MALYEKFDHKEGTETIKVLFDVAWGRTTGSHGNANGADEPVKRNCRSIVTDRRQHVATGFPWPLISKINSAHASAPESKGFVGGFSVLTVLALTKKSVRSQKPRKTAGKNKVERKSKSQSL